MIAQADIPEGLSSGYFSPLILAAILYVVLFIVARVLERREDARAGTADDVGFAIMLLAGAYVVVLALVALVSESELIGDMLVILLIVGAFFGALILILLTVFDLGIGGLSRMRRRRE